MKAILLAGGIGSRLKPITDTTPKCLVPIHGRPLLDIWLEQLTNHGLGPFLINTHYLAEKVEDYISKSVYKKSITIAYEPELLGTAGTVWANKDWMASEPCMLIHADNLCLCDFSAFIQAHQARPARAVLTMMTFETTSPETCGIVEIDHEGMITAMHEKSPTFNGTTANAAVYIAEPEIFNLGDWSEYPPSDFSTEVITNLMGSIYAWKNKGFHEDIGTPDKYNKSVQDIEGHSLWH